MPWFSFHGGHSGEFCRHAKDSLEAVVKRAVAAGFTHYGLSEHAPRFRQEDLLKEESGLEPDDLVRTFQRYAAAARAIQARYADRIRLFVGFETERLPPLEWAAKMAELRSEFDYIVGSVHDVDGAFIDVSAEETEALAGRVGGREELQIRYFDAVTDLVERLKPEVVGHLDLIRKFDPPGSQFSDRVYRHIERCLEAVRGSGGALDVNCGAYRRGFGPVYPLPRILERAREMDILVTLGDDSHGVAGVGVGLDASIAAIRSAGYEEIHCLERLDASVWWRAVPIAEVAPKR
jgi:histidinol-phosphatase (PHP family)